MHRKTRRALRRAIFFISLILSLIALPIAAFGYFKLFRLSTSGIVTKLTFLGTSNKLETNQVKGHREYNYVYYSQFQFTDQSGNIHPFSSSQVVGNDLKVLYDPAFPGLYIIGDKVTSAEYLKHHFLFCIGLLLLIVAVVSRLQFHKKS